MRDSLDYWLSWIAFGASLVALVAAIACAGLVLFF
jgi:hypothetical protein